MNKEQIQEYLDLCYDSGIRRPDIYLKSITGKLWGWLKGCFPRGILPMDVDGEVEINGFFLRLEKKHANCIRNKIMPNGQRRCIEGLLNTGKFTILLIGENDNEQPVCYQIWKRKEGKSPVFDCDQDDIRRFCGKWAEWADAQNNDEKTSLDELLNVNNINKTATFHNQKVPRGSLHHDQVRQKTI